MRKMGDRDGLETVEAGLASRGSDVRLPVMDAFGGWAHRDDLDLLLEEIYEARLTASPRRFAL
jgi:hypothetical protein